MQFIFHNSIEQAEKEFDACMNKSHLVKIKHIRRVIDAVGFDNVPEHMIKHLWDNVYELRPVDGRVIFLVNRNSKAYIIGAYIKKSQKMPSNIQKTLKQREKSLINTLMQENEND